MLRLIALYKLLKVLLLLASAYGVLRLRDATVLERLSHWIASKPSGIEQDFLRRGLAFISGLSPARISALGYVTLAYAAIFTIEGLGLWFRQRWAEWLTIVVTGSLIPLELYELFRRPTIGKAAVLAGNIAIVVYLVQQVQRQGRRSH